MRVVKGLVTQGVTLGFFHISHNISKKQRYDSLIALIKVTDRELSIPGVWTWNMEATGNNTFRTIFSSKVELQCMVEWGVIHTKFLNAKLQIEEQIMDNEVEYVLPKVWIHVTSLTLIRTVSITKIITRYHYRSNNT
jgi:hypothetical protein